MVLFHNIETKSLHNANGRLQNMMTLYIKKNKKTNSPQNIIVNLKEMIFVHACRI